MQAGRRRARQAGKTLQNGAPTQGEACRYILKQGKAGTTGRGRQSEAHWNGKARRAEGERQVGRSNQ
jgi:hypothetical protein